MEKNQVAAGSAFVCQIARNKLKKGLFRSKNSIFSPAAFMFLRRQSEDQLGRDYLAASLPSVLSQFYAFQHALQQICHSCVVLRCPHRLWSLWTTERLGFYSQSAGLIYVTLHMIPNSFCSHSKAFSRPCLSFHPHLSLLTEH